MSNSVNALLLFERARQATASGSVPDVMADAGTLAAQNAVLVSRLEDERAYLKCLVETRGKLVYQYVADVAEQLRDMYHTSPALVYQQYGWDTVKGFTSARRFLLATALGKAIPSQGLSHPWWDVSQYTEFANVYETEAELLAVDEPIMEE